MTTIKDIEKKIRKFVSLISHFQKPSLKNDSKAV